MDLRTAEYIDLAMTPKETRVSEQTIQKFWSDYPMIFYGMDVETASPEQIFEFMERSMRDSGRLLQEPGAPLLSRYIDYEELKSRKALEIGYGTGWLLNELLKAGAQVQGIDLSRSHYELCSYRFRHSDIDIRVGSAEELPYSDDTFDFVCAWGVVHHAANDQRCYDEIRRVLRPGGRAFLMLYRKGGVKYYWTKLFKLGLLRGGLIKHRFSVELFVNSVTDVHYDGSPGAPISRHYTRGDLRRLFRRFSATELQITGSWRELDNFPFGRFPLSNWILGDAEKSWLVHRLGGYWLVDLVK